jgi:hypothetical protein
MVFTPQSDGSAFSLLFHVSGTSAMPAKGAAGTQRRHAKRNPGDLVPFGPAKIDALYMRTRV